MLNKPKTALGTLKVLVTGKDVEERKKKWKTNSRKLTDARNEYILSLSAINAMQNSYYENDLPNLIKVNSGKIRKLEFRWRILSNNYKYAYKVCSS